MSVIIFCEHQAKHTRCPPLLRLRDLALSENEDDQRQPGGDKERPEPVDASILLRGRRICLDSVHATKEAHAGKRGAEVEHGAPGVPIVRMASVIVLYSEMNCVTYWVY